MKKRFVKFLAVTVIGAMALGTLAGCGKKEAPAAEAPAETTETAETATEDEGIAEEDMVTGIAAEYTSPQGWMVSYDADNIACNEYEDHTDFVYIGECGGTQMFTYTYIEGKLPAAVMEEVKEKIGNPDAEVYDGPFLTGEPALTILDGDANSGSGMTTQYTAVEHNGDTLLIEAISHTEPEERAYEVHGRMEALYDSFIWLQPVK